jgi:hypothetical protein
VSCFVAGLVGVAVACGGVVAPPPGSQVSLESEKLALPSGGGTIAAGGSIVVVGAPRAGPDGSGAALVLEARGDAWEATATLSAADAALRDAFGVSVATDGKTVLVGAPYRTSTGVVRGGAYVFERTGDGWSSVLLEPPSGTAYDWIGSTVAVDGSHVLMSASVDGTSVLAIPYERTSSGWMAEPELRAPDPLPHGAIAFVATSGDFAMVGVPSGTDGLPVPGGVVYVFTRTAGAWSFLSRLRPDDLGSQAGFGLAVAMSGTRAIVGSRASAAYVYERTAEGWRQEAKLTAWDTTPDDGFGHAVGLRGTTAIVGAVASGHDGLMNAGSAYLFTRDGSSWAQRRVLRPSDATTFGQFGAGVATVGSTCVVRNGDEAWFFSTP